jgi:hypothetical protein
VLDSETVETESIAAALTISSPLPTQTSTAQTALHAAPTARLFNGYIELIVRSGAIASALLQVQNALSASRFGGCRVLGVGAVGVDRDDATVAISHFGHSAACAVAGCPAPPRLAADEAIVRVFTHSGFAVELLAGDDPAKLLGTYALSATARIIICGYLVPLDVQLDRKRIG